MAFLCQLQLNNGAIRSSDALVFMEWIEPVWGKYHSETVVFAKIQSNDTIAYVSTNCPCRLKDKSELLKGDKIFETTILGTFEADGEDIPYNKPYALIKVQKY